MKKANKRLIDDRGRIPYGVLETPVDVINYRDFDLRTVMDKPRSMGVRAGSGGSETGQYGVFLSLRFQDRTDAGAVPDAAIGDGDPH